MSKFINQKKASDELFNWYFILNILEKIRISHKYFRRGTNTNSQDRNSDTVSTAF